MTAHDSCVETLKRNKIPVPEGVTLVQLRFKAVYADWWALTKEKGWLYMRTQDVKEERREWQQSYYGPM